MHVFQVGGAVRDRLLGKEPKDIDWVVVGATPEQMLRQGFQQVGKDFPVFLHPSTGQEYALARTERKVGSGHTGFTVQIEGVTLEDDLSRRDLTINAMAMGEDGKVIDPFKGQEDLRDRVLRHVGPAFEEDPLRVLRVARFAARLGFAVAGSTLDVMERMVLRGDLNHLTPERVWGEIEKALTSDAPWNFFRQLRKCEALRVLFPELAALIDVPQPAKHHPEGDVWTHMGLVMDRAAEFTPDPVTRFGALVHDLGKGVTPKDVLPQHLKHEDAGVALVEAFCRRFKAPTEFESFGKLVAEFHTHRHRALEMRPGSIVDLLERFKVRHGLDRVKAFLVACEADAKGRGGDFPTRPQPQTDFLWNCAMALREIKAVPGDDPRVVRENLRQAQCKAVKQIRGKFDDVAGMA